MSSLNASDRDTWNRELAALETLIMDKPRYQELNEALNKLKAKSKLWTYEAVPKPKQTHTLLGLAIQSQNLEGLKILMKSFGLSTLPEESSAPNEATDLFCLAVVYYHESVFRYVSDHIDVDRALRQLRPRQRSVLHVAARAGTTGMFRILHEAKGDDIKSKILHVRDSQQQTALHVAVSMNHVETVDELIRIQPELIRVQDALGETVFHKAVATNKKDALERLLARDAEVLTQCDSQGNSPYRHLLEGRSKQIIQNSPPTSRDAEGVQRTQSFDDSVSSLLIQAILTLENVSVVDKRKFLFKDALGPDLQCDMSIFNADNLDFTEYLDDLKEDRLDIKFHETLIRVVLPDLSCLPKKACAITLPHPLRKNSEANLVFDYLSRKGVKRVIEAVIPDCTVHPHSNRNIINALKAMGVKRLNWRKLNLGVSTIQMAAPEVETLTLYSSGDADALLQLSGPEGLCRLEKLQQIHIIIYRGEDNDDELEELRKRCEDALARLKKKELRVTLAELVSADGKGDDTPPPLYHRHQGQTTILENLSPFHKLLSRQNGLPSNPTIPKDELIKVAILDSGVYANRSIFPNLTGGSFVEDTATADSHWHTVTNSHGTKMASLIREVNPYCHIYAARTHFGADMHGGDVYSLNKALEWVTKQRVDIICISWTCSTEIKGKAKRELEAKIQEASKESLIFCATGDKGPEAKVSFPAGFENTFKIGNCSIVGKHLDDTEIEHTEFLVPAQGLAVEVPKYIKKDGKDTAEGSSAATAVAAGLAALVLSLSYFATSRRKSSEQISDRAEQFAYFKSTSVMKSVFQHMCGSSTSKFVQPWQALPRDLHDLELDLAKTRVQNFLDQAGGEL